MFTDVIIGFNGTPPARDALALGRRLGEAAGATITVVCAHPYMALTADVEADPAVEPSWRKGAERTLVEAFAVLSATDCAMFRSIAETSPARAACPVLVLPRHAAGEMDDSLASIARAAAT